MSQHVPDTTSDETVDDGLRPALEALRRQWLIAMATFVVVIAFGMFYVLRIPVEYQSGAVVSFVPRASSEASGDMAALLVERYPEVVASESALDAAGEAAGVEPGEVNAGLSAIIQPGTLNMVFSTTLATNDQAVAATTALFETVLAANRSDPDLRAVTVSEPLGWGPTGASTTLLTGAVGIAAAVLAFTAALVTDGLRRRPDNTL